MSTDTKIKTLIFNKLTQEQYNNADRVPTEFYLTPDTSIDSSEKGVANGVASLDTNGKVPTEQIPVATTSALGGVKPDGTTITVTEDGTISAATGSSTIGFSIGDVVFSYSSLASENPGKLPLFTGETIASANTIYPDFYNWVLAHTELQCTSAEYEAALTTYGECAKYVIGDGSLRLPLIKNYIKAANTTEGIKNIEAGLPNIVGTFRGTGTNSSSADDPLVSGAFTAKAIGVGFSSASGNDVKNYEFSASKSNTTYGKSSTVTPASTTLYPWVVAYTAAIPASTAQAAEFQQALSGKADTNLGNTTPSQSFKEMSVGWGMPDYSAGIEVPPVSFVSGYTASIDSVFYINGQHPSGITITVDNNYVGVLGGTVSTISVKVKKGQVIKLSVAPQASSPAIYFPLEGVN